MKKIPFYLILFLSIIILVLLYNLFINKNGFQERNNLINQNKAFTERNNALKNSNEELIFEIINAQDDEEHIENQARESLNLSMPEEQFVKFEKIESTSLESKKDE
tara:strand:+ start:976 stop:1293 length:318 start_codon:yes stop_codon:yes gene_type:complete